MRSPAHSDNRGLADEFRRQAPVGARGLLPLVAYDRLDQIAGTSSRPSSLAGSPPTPDTSREVEFHGTVPLASPEGSSASEPAELTGAPVPRRPQTDHFTACTVLYELLAMRMECEVLAPQ